MPTATVESPRSVAFLGDSYTEGAGSSRDRANRWTTVVSGQLGFAEINFAVGGTGYFQGGDRSYQARVEGVIAADPDIVVVSGGRNDWAVDPDDQSAAVTAVFESLSAGLPDAQIIAISPWWDDDEAPSELNNLAAMIRDAVDAVGGSFIEGGQPLSGQPGLMSGDGIHPNDEGYAAIAAAVSARLEEITRQADE